MILRCLEICLFKKYKLKNIKLGYRSFKILQKNNKLYLVNKILTSCCQFPLISKNKDKYFSSLSYQQYLTEKLCKGELKKNLTIQKKRCIILDNEKNYKKKNKKTY